MTQHDPDQQYQQQPQYDPRMYPPPGYEIRKHRSWPRRHWFLTFVTFPVLALIVIIVIAVAASSGGTSPASAAGSSTSTSSDPSGAGNPACGKDLATMKTLIAKGDYQDAGSDATDDSEDATRQHAILGSGIASDYDQLGADAASAGLDKMSGGSTYAHDKSEVQQDLAALEKDCGQ